MLKRHLMTSYKLTPEAYRERWGLPSNYPMVAPSYAERRSALAKSIGLGRKPAAAPGEEPATARRASQEARPQACPCRGGRVAERTLSFGGRRVFILNTRRP